MAAAHCGGKGPTAPPAGPFTQCPADIQLDSPDGGPVTVTYSSPGASGGTPPYEVTCTPPSGTAVGLGTSTVTCSVIDSTGRGAICSFNVTVVRPPRLALSRFLAFGDSMTDGEVSAPPTIRYRVFDPPNSYPVKLDGLLRAYFRGQSLIVIRSGVGGERVQDPPTKLRLRNAILDNRPEVVLLMEGVNDLNLALIPGGAGLDGVRPAAEGMEDMVEEAQSLGMRVFLATIPPARPPGTKQLSMQLPELIASYNGQIGAIALRHGAVFVDVYGAMRDRPDLIGADGLHPTVQGYEVIAQTFFDAIKRELEIRYSLTP